MSDILEVVVLENPFELVFNDMPLEVLIVEDNFEIAVNEQPTEILILEENIEVLTIAEQGPPGVGGSGGLGIAIGNTPPSNPAVWDLWLDTN